ncbi:MAG: NAD-dependent epimerase/dehydratase family protein [Gammaproteobacteria bacterium]
MSRALITGGAGGIGLHLAQRLLREGWEVTLLDNFQRGRRDADLAAVTTAPGVTLLDLDLGRPEALAAIGTRHTHVYHLAARLGVQNVLERPRAVLEDNVALTLAALAAARRQDALECFLFASTSEVYAGTLEHFSLPIPTPETTPLALPPLARARTSYMLSKLYGEALCLHAGLPVTIIRPHNVYGPRMGSAHVIPQMLERAHRLAPGTAFDVYSAEHTRTFCYVDDAVEMILALSTTAAARGEAVNVGTQAPEIRMDSLARIVLAAVGRSATIVPAPATEGSPPRRAPDMSRCRALTGYTSRVTLEEGVARTWAWYREHVSGD